MNTQEFNLFLKELYDKVFCGTGFVICPPDVDRKKYIETCYRTSTVSIYPDTGGTSYNNIPVSLSVIQDIEFPEENHQFGSQVVYILHPKHRTPIIIAIINKKNELSGAGWKKFYLNKVSKDGEVQILGDGSKGNLIVKVESSSGGNGIIDVKLLKKDSTAKFSLQVQGDVFLVAKNIQINNDATRLLSRERILLGIADEDKDIGAEGGYQSVMLGNNLSEWVKDFCSLLKELTVATGVGPSGFPLPDWTTKLDNLYNKFEENLSKKVFVE